MGFVRGRDRLFSVGDLIDRGPESAQALAWLEDGRIAGAVLGNHEDMMLRYLESAMEGGRAVDVFRRLWRDQGGQWWFGRERGAGETGRWIRALRALPWTLTIETPHGEVGIVHAQPPAPTWRESVARCADPRDEVARARALWSRGRYGVWQEEIGEREGEWAGGCADVRLVVCGHTPVDEAHRHDNLVNIDTGAFRRRGAAKLTLARIDTAGLVLHGVGTAPRAEG